MRILIIEDEFNLADAICSRLEKEKYNCDIACDGAQGLDYALTNAYDLIILDIMLPTMNGVDILKQLKDEGIESKVIMLTAKTMIDDKLECFSLGADDYLTKPFHMDELIARVNIKLRKEVKDESIIEIGNTKLNIKTSTLSTDKDSIDIVGKEFQLLEYLMKNNGQVISKDMIINKIWGIDNEYESNNLEVYLTFIRRKLKLIESNVNIKAIRGLGYKIEVKDGKTT
jgi:DNA-binding response OmpR family regulator